MKMMLFAALAGVAFAGAANAQSDTTGSHNPAIKNNTPRTTAAAAKGRNSFTEHQAQVRIGKAGFTNVSGLAKNGNGVWQGTAMKGGSKVNVALDYKGNVTVH
ncbi:hypothetical protein [Sphingomonas sp. PAMC 26621]|uniref:hypothetical protein n=1 Tax=Sphingomonas sp. PAMC 26621 TaxID=1112213 RepID=UPI0002892473|nr:hypothetical protein [Sphingomonas sp. PAMC 26621]